MHSYNVAHMPVHSTVCNEYSYKFADLARYASTILSPLNYITFLFMLKMAEEAERSHLQGSQDVQEDDETDDDYGNLVRLLYGEHVTCCLFYFGVR